MEPPETRSNPVTECDPAQSGEPKDPSGARPKGASGAQGSVGGPSGARPKGASGAQVGPCPGGNLGPKWGSAHAHLGNQEPKRGSFQAGTQGGTWDQAEVGNKLQLGPKWKQEPM